MCSVQPELKWKRTKGTWCFLIQKFCDHLREELSNLWTMSPISPIKRLHCSKRADHMKKESIDHPVCQLTQVFSQHTCSLIEVRCTTGVHVATVKSTLFVMDSASGFWPDAAPFLSTYQNLVTTNFVTANFPQTLHSAMELISNFGNGEQKTIVDFGVFGVSLPFGPHGDTGCSHSTNDRFKAFRAMLII